MMISPEVLEPSIQKVGRNLADQSLQRAPGIFDHRRWTNLLLDWGTRDERFKVQLFRFVDVLPTLQTDAQFIRILKEYFVDLSILPQPLRWAAQAHIFQSPQRARQCVSAPTTIS